MSPEHGMSVVRFHPKVICSHGMRDDPVLEALGVAVPGWRARRTYPFVFAATLSGEGPRRERLLQLFEAALGDALDPAGDALDLGERLDAALDEPLDRTAAHAAIVSLLGQTLAYDVDWIPRMRATAFADALVGRFTLDAAYLSNGDLWRRDGSGRSWNPLTTAVTFDTGVVGLDDSFAAGVWIFDDD